MEKPRLKINVGDIFNEPSRTSEEEDNSRLNSSQQPSLLENHSPDPPAAAQPSKARPSFIKTSQIMQPKVTAEAQLLSLTRLIRQKETTIKKIEVVDTDKITAKLIQPRSPVCSKILKKNVIGTHSACKLSPQKMEKESPKEAKLSRISKNNLSKSSVHERLYNMSKSQFLKQAYVSPKSEKPEPKTHRKSLSSLSSSKYLKNYTPFEKRLEEYLNREQFNASQSMLRSEHDFRPQLIPNKYTDRVHSRYRQTQLRDAKPSDFADFMNSSVSSSCVSATSRSAAISQQVETHFMQKMKLVFVRGPEQEIEIEESTVGLLTEVEFAILQPFIMEIEQNRIVGSEFERKFRDYYESLTPADRMQLRNHEVKNKCKYRQLKDEIKRKKSAKKELFKVLERPEPNASSKGLPKKELKGNPNYHSVIQNFI